MADEADLPSDSESSDEDYIPDEPEAVSEEEESGEEEAPGDGESGKDRGTKRKKRKQEGIDFTRKRRGGIKLEDEAAEEKTDDSPVVDAEKERRAELEKGIKEEKEEKQKEQEKKKSDDLWASFLTDVGPRPSAKAATSSSSKTESTLTTKVSKPPEKSETKRNCSASNSIKETIKITKEYDFAGETVRITKEVSADSKEALAEQKKKEKEEKAEEKPVGGVAALMTGAKRPGGGLGSVLGKIGKKPKMGTLEKSKLDWQSFKSSEGIEEELQIHNRGKAGFIERQAFLQRTDQRQFEIERDLRQGLGGKR